MLRSEFLDELGFAFDDLLFDQGDELGEALLGVGGFQQPLLDKVIKVEESSDDEAAHHRVVGELDFDIEIGAREHAGDEDAEGLFEP